MDQVDQVDQVEIRIHVSKRPGCHDDDADGKSGTSTSPTSMLDATRKHAVVASTIEPGKWLLHGLT
jgi:hypothetical protein